ncbi:zinc finger protein [Elysia marginata]|uniref:Zinc finger protein n=1 Tax=Elysia marginata TaxID=1093978 RepID=A0AAV4JXZ4_9GAST|nr:zinc finger protein [Elysia marginata]
MRLETEMKMLQAKIQAGIVKEETDGNTSRFSDASAKHPKLPHFQDGKDDLDVWLTRFERFAESNNWSRDKKSSSLCALLTGPALDCYGRLSTEQTQDYNKVKQALMKRYDLTEDGYRRKFPSCKPMEVAMDIVGPINPPSEAGHRFILTHIDYATRYAEAVPLRKIDTETVAEALVDIYSRLGVPEEVLSDQGTQFMSDCMKEFCRLLGKKQKATTPYHPMCNGLVERFNATLKTCLRRLFSEQPRQWHRYINPLLFSYREVPQESTHFAPFELLYGRTVRGPMRILRELWTKDIEEPEVKISFVYVLNLRERLDDTLKIAREELEKAQGRQKHYYDRTAKCRKFSVGEKVLVLLPTDSNKLLMQWKGPFEVVATVGVNDYRINMGGKVKTFHANLLNGYIARDQDIHQAAASLTVIEDIEGEHFNDSDCETLPELGGWGSNETVKDLQYGDQLTPDQRRQLEEIASSYSSFFSDRPGTALTEEHRIELTSSTPVRQRPYPVPYAMRQTLCDELEKMEDL